MWGQVADRCGNRCLSVDVGTGGWQVDVGTGVCPWMWGHVCQWMWGQAIVVFLWRGSFLKSLACLGIILLTLKLKHDRILAPSCPYET